MKTRSRRCDFASIWLVAGVLIGLCACPPNVPTPDPVDPPGPAATGTATDTATTDPAPTQPAGWRHTRTSLTVKLGSARHSAVDVIANPGSSPGVRGKFAYGKLSKDLEDEEVWLQIADEAGNFTSVGKGRTDGDGRVTILLPARFLERAGAHRFRFLVSGDLSTAEGYVWLLERGTKVVVFDIDGTLTTGDSELIDDAFGGDIDVRNGAVDVVRHWADTGHTPVFLTGRPYMYNRSTRAWLHEHGFPAGPMITADSLGQAMPSAGGVGTFKREWLRALIGDVGVSVQAAYGNASTDICGFAQAGISPSVTYIIDNDQKACDGFGPVNLIAGQDYLAHVASLRQ